MSGPSYHKTLKNHPLPPGEVDKIVNSAKQWRTAFDALSDVVIITDGSDKEKILRCNKSARNFFNAEYSRILDRSLKEFIPESLYLSLEELNEKFLKNGQRIATTIQDDSRSYRCVFEPVWDEDHHLCARVTILTDITHAQKLEKQLHQAQKMEAMGRLARGVAHDFNNILTAIIGNIEILMMENPESNSVSEVGKNVLNTVDHAIRLNRQLMTFCRTQAFNPVRINVNEFLASIMESISSLLPPGIDCSFHPTSIPLLIHADPSQIEQILLNLIFNARDAMPAGGTITVSTGMVSLNKRPESRSPEPQGENRTAFIAVSDTGMGIPASSLDRIFDPFFTTKEDGTGLGLSTVYGIVRQLKGKIQVKSEPGCGTSFHISLPLAGDEKP